MEEKSSELIKRILDIYLFSDMMFFKENKFLKRRLTRKEKEILEKNKIKSDSPYELVRKRISEYVDNYYNTNIDDSVFNGFEEKKRNHLIKLNNSISILKQNVKNQILDKISSLLINEDESYLRFDKLSDYLKGLVETNDKKITALYGQIGFCVLLWNYEELGYDTYRLINSYNCCDVCSAQSQTSQKITDFEKNIFFPFIHPNCRCKIEIINSDGKTAFIVDFESAKNYLKKLEYEEETKEILNNLDEEDLIFFANTEYVHSDYNKSLLALCILKNSENDNYSEKISKLKKAGFEDEEAALLELSYRIAKSKLFLSDIDAQDKISRNEAISYLLAEYGGIIAEGIINGKNTSPVFNNKSSLDMLEKNGYLTSGQKTQKIKSIEKNAINYKIHKGRQDKHIVGTNNYNLRRSRGENPSILTFDADKLLKKGAGKGRMITPTKESVDYGRIIGKFYSQETGKYYYTTVATICYDTKGNAHIVPARPKWTKLVFWREY